ncbi:hypothetical protein TRIUR3_04536 [Triticum urartu]|uniref:Uncharacterized protein n=1 Tax=Triticum urartu TaxID=4572 RepID=M7ZM58_TRIUA|nr:hypothetical protein TRIUR3_04536 [Triticum urartu]
MHAAKIPARHLHPHASVILHSHAKTRPVKYNYTVLIREPLPSTSEEHGFSDYPFVLSRPSIPSTTSTRLHGLYQVPLHFIETSKSEDPKYHDNPEGIQIRQVALPMTRTATKHVPLPSSREDPVDVKFRVVTPNIYGNLCD